MNWLDYLFLAIFVVAIAVGAARGLARGIVGLVAVVVGILFACRWYGEAGAFLHAYVSSRAVANGVGFGLILAGFLIAGAIVGRLLATAFKWIGMTWLDRLLGAGFGFLKAALICIALVMIAMAFPRYTLPETIIHSKFAPYFVQAAGTLAVITPPDLKEAFWRNYDEVRKVWEDMLEGDKRPRETQI